MRGDARAVLSSAYVLSGAAAGIVAKARHQHKYECE